MIVYDEFNEYDFSTVAKCPKNLDTIDFRNLDLVCSCTKTVAQVILILSNQYNLKYTVISESMIDILLNDYVKLSLSI